MMGWLVGLCVGWLVYVWVVLFMGECLVYMLVDLLAHVWVGWLVVGLVGLRVDWLVYVWVGFLIYG